VLAWAVVRPRGWPEKVAAVTATRLVIAAGAIPARDAITEARRLGQVIGFLTAVLVLAQTLHPLPRPRRRKKTTRQ
jgi:arsenical pump membrane protein